MERTILHSDLNNFFASVECALNPQLRGLPVAVAGNPELRHGIVLAKSNEAKACGVKTGDTLWEARGKCRDIIFVPPHYDKYMEYSDAVRNIYAEYTDNVESYGLDECWLDVTGSSRLFGRGKAIADNIREKVKRNLGVSVSVGVSYNKVFAKLGSDIKKPDATTVIDKEHFREIVWPLPVEDLLYVGASSAAKLHRYGINTIGSLANADEKLLSCLLGKNGQTLVTFARGEDVSPVGKINAPPPLKSISCGHTPPRDLKTAEEVKILLYALAENVSARLRKHGFVCRTVQLHIRDCNLESFERQCKLEYPCRTCAEIFTAAYALYKSNAAGMSIRSVSVRACDLIYREYEQLSFSEEIFKIQRRETLEATADSLNERFGAGTLRRGILLTDTALTEIGPKSTPGILPGRMVE